MSKTIGAEISQDKSNAIEEYCKKNNITKSDFVKNSINNTMNKGVVPEQNLPISIEPTKKDIKDMSIFEINELLKKENKTKKYSKNDVERQIKPKMKLEHQKEFLEHLKNRNCSFWNDCKICNVKESIKNAGMKEQENIDLKIFEKYLPQLQAKMIH